MKKKTILSAIGAILIILSVVWIAIPRHYYSFYVIFSNIAGLHQDSPVFYSNKKVGYVKGIENVGSKLRVKLAVRANVKIMRNALINIKTEFIKPYRAYVNITPIYIQNGYMESKRMIKPRDMIIGISPDNMSGVLMEAASIMPGLSDEMRNAQKLSKKVKPEYMVPSPTEILANAVMRNSELLQQTAKEFKNAAATIRENTGKMGKGINRLISNLNDRAVEDRRSIYTTTNNFAAISHELKKTVDAMHDYSKVKPRIEVKIPKVAGLPQPQQENNAAGAGGVPARGKKEWQVPSVKDIISKVKPHLRYGLEYSNGSNAVTNNVDLKLASGYKSDYLIAGLQRENDGYKYNLQYAKRVNEWNQRIGLMESEVGLGLDYNFNDNSKLSLDVKGLTSEPQVDVAAQYKLKNDYRVKFGINNFYKDSKFVFGMSKQY